MFPLTQNCLNRFTIADHVEVLPNKHYMQMKSNRYFSMLSKRDSQHRHYGKRIEDEAVAGRYALRKRQAGGLVSIHNCPGRETSTSATWGERVSGCVGYMVDLSQSLFLFYCLLQDLRKVNLCFLGSYVEPRGYRKSFFDHAVANFLPVSGYRCCRKSHGILMLFTTVGESAPGLSCLD